MTGPVAQTLDELSRRIAGMVRIGLIAEVDYPNTRIRVRSGDITTGWLPWPADMGRNYVAWRPLQAGQQVILLSPSGDLGQAVVVGLLHVATDPPPSTDETMDVIRFRSGTQIVHDATTGNLAITCAGDLDITATGTARITASRVEMVRRT